MYHSSLTERAKAERIKAEAELRTSKRSVRMSRSEIAALVTEIGGIARAITEAPDELKNETYRRIGLRLTYHPDQTKVRAEIHLSPHIVKRYVSEGETLDTYMPFAASTTLILPGREG